MPANNYLDRISLALFKRDRSRYVKNDEKYVSIT